MYICTYCKYVRYVHNVNMLSVHIFSKKKKKKKKTDLLPLGSLFLLGLNSAPLSLCLSLLRPSLEGKKKGGGQRR